MTDVGRKRPHNEDAYFHDDAMQMYVVADGMGGHAAGEVASWEAVQAVQLMVKSGRDQIDAYLANPCEDTIATLRRLVESGIQAATYMVFGIAEQDPEHKGMGTTITAMLVINRRRCARNCVCSGPKMKRIFGRRCVPPSTV